MKYQSADFTDDLRRTIESIETKAEEHVGLLVAKYRPLFSERNLEFDAGFDREGMDPFTPPYRSSLSIGMFGEEEELIHTAWIWQCDREWMGISVSRAIPGSKITGLLFVQTFEEIQQELKETVEEFLSGL
ncbi:hypothetical protein [Planococcus shenhongbingii]|uniref:Uncharacterized protein n=1 Tax=Planococcus shenhongbingii TaxID=3058398 RepID=A0ABT8NCD3_9BACL|nr:hypothetical protein [Planococcus sp. N017]MDN7245562.1 hypothetical protein [Planococcus sp. N017]